jgi:tagatose 1,6-diphosphate aldolase
MSPNFPPPPLLLSYSDIAVQFFRIVPGDDSRGFVPYYHFRILAADGSVAGHINLRVGDTEHVELFAGHIGFEVAEAYRGRRFAYKACCALGPFVRSIAPAVIITCDPDNVASRRTIELLGAEFLEEVSVPPHDPHYARGSRLKRRYRWNP